VRVTHGGGRDARGAEGRSRGSGPGLQDCCGLRGRGRCALGRERAARRPFGRSRMRAEAARAPWQDAGETRRRGDRCGRFRPLRAFPVLRPPSASLRPRVSMALRRRRERADPALRGLGGARSGRGALADSVARACARACRCRHAAAARPRRADGNRGARESAPRPGPDVPLRARLVSRGTGLMGVARPAGFEPTTPRSVVWCSIQLSYGRPRPPKSGGGRVLTEPPAGRKGGEGGRRALAGLTRRACRAPASLPRPSPGSRPAPSPAA
jgi:hypothetical protein